MDKTTGVLLVQGTPLMVCVAVDTATPSME